MDDIKQFKELQRYPKQGEPVCVVCARYAEYICSVTEADVCSTECKKNNLNRRDLEIPPIKAESYESYIYSPILSNIDTQPSKAELDVLPAVLYKKDIIIIAPVCFKRTLALVIPLIQRLLVTGNVISS
jgi:superfamily II DNA/RNA helicase